MINNQRQVNQPLSAHRTCIDADSIEIKSINHLIIAQCKFDPSQFNENDYEQLAIQLPNSLKDAVTRRKSEFLAGRYLAMLALASIGKPHYHIPIGENRAPVWPDNIVGSISHSQNIAQCILSRDQYYQYLGLDIEHWISETDTSDISDSIVTNASEYLLVMRALPFNKAITLIFSAKESLFKAIYKEVGHYFEFSAAKVSAFDLTENSLTLTLTENLSTTMHSGKQFQCRYEIAQDSVTTLISCCRSAFRPTSFS